MIAKGNARAGGQNLATHLLNAHDNERVEIADMRGSVANDLHGAFAEWRAQAKATRCEKYLYSLSVNPDQRQGRLTRAQYLDYLARVEQQLGLSRQGRVVVFHEKKDKDGIAREHCHAVWSRIDAKAGRAVSLSHDRMKLRSVARQFAQAMGLKLPRGLSEDRGRERHEARKPQANLQEKQQQERSGISKEERQAMLTKAWQETKDGAGFATAVKNAGYLLAQGDSRAYVVVDRAGEIHSLARQLLGVKTTELKARLSPSLPASSLPTAQEAVTQMAAQRDRLRVFKTRTAPMPAPEERRAMLGAQQAARQVQRLAERAQMEARHAKERTDLRQAQSLSAAFTQSQAKRGRRVSGLVQRIAGKAEQRQQDKELAGRHRAENREMRRQEKALTALDKREWRSLETRIRRDDFQHVLKETKTREERLMPSTAANQVRPPEREAMPMIPAAARQSRLQDYFAGKTPPARQAPTKDEAAEQAERERREQERLRELQNLPRFER